MRPGAVTVAVAEQLSLMACQESRPGCATDRGMIGPSGPVARQARRCRLTRTVIGRHSCLAAGPGVPLRYGARASQGVPDLAPARAAAAMGLESAGNF
jgi:hypothetical protein